MSKPLHVEQMKVLARQPIPNEFISFQKKFLEQLHESILVPAQLMKEKPRLVDEIFKLAAKEKENDNF